VPKRSDLLFSDVISAGDDVILVGDRHGWDAGKTDARRLGGSEDGVDGQASSTDDRAGRAEQLDKDQVATEVDHSGAPAVRFDAVRDATAHH